MAEHYIPSSPFYSATVLHSATEQYKPGSRNADEEEQEAGAEAEAEAEGEARGVSLTITHPL